MQSKSLLIAVAAFALTATSVHAYGGVNILNRAGLSEKQVVAIQAAQQLREEGDIDAARDLLADAGITEETLLSISQAAKELRSEMRQALEDGDWETFKAVIDGTSLADSIVTEDDFNQFKEAHLMRMNGDWSEAAEILDEIGVDVDKKNHYQRKIKRAVLDQLSDDQKAALQVARQANDRATIQAIFDEAGLEYRSHNGR